MHFQTDMEHNICRSVNNSDVSLGYQFCKNITFILCIIYNVRYNNTYCSPPNNPREMTYKTLAQICAAGKQPYCSPSNNPIVPRRTTQFPPTREITYKTFANICAAGKRPYCSPPNNPIFPHNIIKQLRLSMQGNIQFCQTSGGCFPPQVATSGCLNARRIIHINREKSIIKYMYFNFANLLFICSELPLTVVTVHTIHAVTSLSL